MSVKDDVLEFIIDRAPNYVRASRIIDRLSNKHASDKIMKAIEELEKETTIRVKKTENHITKQIEFGCQYSALGRAPIRDQIMVGDVWVNRVLQSDEMVFTPEDINDAVESLSHYAYSLEDKFIEMVKQEQSKYWGNVITLFGVFVAIFSFIVVSLPQIEIESVGFWTIVVVNTAKVLPLALVLAVFIYLLHKLFR